MVENAAERRRALSTGKAKQNAIQRGAPQNDTAIINASELNKLMKIIKGPSTDAQARQENLQHQQLQAQKSAEHKMRLLEIDEARRSKGIAPSMDEIEKEELKRLERSQAKHKMEEELDEVKYMNKILLYAKCVTVRDAQLAEKAQIKAEEHEESRHLDLIMEAERQRALKAYQEREVKRTIDRKKGAAVIRAQIEEREQERLRQLELKQQEQEAMLRHIVRMKEEDKVESLRKKEAAQKLMEQVALSNAEQIRVKNRQREQELEEDQRIAAYLREKERREQELQHEQELLRAEKEKEIARLRSLQEKAQDKQAEMDALRARRAQEAREREWRQKEAEAVRRQQAINNDLAQARERQKLEKELLLAEQARVEHEEFGRIVSIKLEEEHRERQIQEEEKAKRRAHAEELKRQIQQIEESRKNERRAFLEEGEKLKAQRKAEREKIEAIRHRKMTELEHLAVPVKYRSDLVKRRELEPLRPVK